MPKQQIFYDPQRKRWKRLRRVFDLLALFSILVGIVFIVGLLRMRPMRGLDLQSTTKRYRALSNPPAPELTPREKLHQSAHRKTDLKPSDVVLNTTEGLRAAFYTDVDPASYASLKQHIKQIDLLFPEWLHVITPDGHLTAFSADNTPFPVIDSAGVHGVDRENKVAHVITAAREDTEIFPMVNNYNPKDGAFEDNVTQFLANASARANFVQQVDRFLAANTFYRGLTLDFQALGPQDQSNYNALIAALYADFHPRNLRLYVNVPVSTPPAQLTAIAANSDGIVLMDYDQHQTGTQPGPIADQNWFENNLRTALAAVPRQKIICSIGNYAYDWSTPLPAAPGPGTPAIETSKNRARMTRRVKAPQQNPDDTAGQTDLDAVYMTTQEAWQAASDSDAKIDLDDPSLNPHFAYVDEDAHVRHQVWLLDAVTALNEMRVARALGLETFALWRLGSEDASLWNVWDNPLKVDPAKALADIAPGWDVDTEGDGDILRVTSPPQNGRRSITMDDDATIPSQFLSVVSESIDKYPLPYTVSQYGYRPKEVAITFDDGPDPTWTPRVLDILKREHVVGTFFMIGEEAEDNVGLMKRVYREGHEIGNHTFTHPDISEISDRSVDLQLNLTERLFAAKLGVQPVYFRPPYSIDQEPDTNDQAAPIERIQQLGYTIIGDKIDTNDWDEHPRKTPQEIIDSVFAQIALSQTKTWMKGSIILMHDGGGNRQPTIDALPRLIEALRAHGYTIVPVSELVGKSRAEVMPPLVGRRQHMQAAVDSIAFFLISFFNHFVIDVFFIGDFLMSLRLIIIGICAVIDRFRKRHDDPNGEYCPRVAVLIPAYNEEKVIARTIRSVLMSNYKNLRVIVIDDGSRDDTYRIATETYAKEIEQGRVTVLTKPNGGKAEALNFALEQTSEEVYVGIDADGVIAHDAISRLVCHFANPKIGAVAGNAKVGNRVNLWTRWQALEYITSQNFERRALDLFDVVTVVPGAIGAWRTSAVKAGGSYHPDTVAEDADLTMSLLEQGYWVIYEDQALAFTEAPINANGLARQRFRWSFGILQALYKHKAAIRNRRAMGIFALPNILIFQILLPLVSPLIDLMFVAGVIHYFIDKHFHPETTSTADLVKLLVFFGAFLLIDFAASVLAFALERKHPASKGDAWLLVHIWIQRFTYRQLFSWVLLKTVKRAIDGKPFNWDKLERTAKMSRQAEQLAQQ